MAWRRQVAHGQLNPWGHPPQQIPYWAVTMEGIRPRLTQTLGMG